MSKNILVFDSGIGGLSIANKILEQLPNIELDYAFDNGAFPYGDKQKDWLLARILEFMQKAMTLSKPDLLVIACNTASTLALENLRKEFSIPIVGVVPAIKPSVEISKTKQIIMLATPNTIKSSYTKKLLEDFAFSKNAKVHLIGDKDLVNQAERIMRNQALDKSVIARVAKEIQTHQDADTIVLACTHYPFLKEIFIEALDKKIYNWIDSSQAIVKRTADLLDLDLITKTNTNIQTKTNLKAETANNLNNLDSLNSQKLNKKSEAKNILTSKQIENSALTENLKKLGFKQFINIDF